MSHCSLWRRRCLCRLLVCQPFLGWVWVSPLIEGFSRRRQVKPVTFSQMKNAKSSFQYAALVGSKAESVAECAQVFDQCPFDRLTIMNAFNATK